MKKLILFKIFIFLITSQLYSQKPLTKSIVKISIDWGIKYKNSQNEFIRDIIYDDGKNIYAVVNTYKNASAKSVTPSIVKFDNKMSPIKRKEYVADEDGIYLHKTFYLGGSFVLITSKYNSKTNTREFHAQKLNTNLDLDGQSKLLWTVVGKKSDDINLSINISEDSTKFFIAVFPEQNYTDKKKYAFKVFDSDLNGVFEKIEDLNIPSYMFKLKSIQVNNKSDVFVLSKESKNRNLKVEIRSENGKVPGYKYLVNKYSKDGSKKEYELNLKSKFINNIFSKIESNGDLSLLLTYEESYNDGINGTIFLKLDANTGNINTINEYTFTKELAERIGTIQSDRPNKKSSALSNFFSVTDLHTVEDGSTYVILENNYIDSHEHMSEGLVALKINSDGNVKWCKYIPKLQRGAIGDYWLYHLAMYYKNDLFIFYNDKDDNDQYDITNSTKHPKEFVNDIQISFIQIEFDEDGNIKRKVISNGKQMETSITMSLSKQLSPNRMVLCGLTMNGFAGNRETKLGVANFE